VRRPPSVNLGPPNISETTRARKLKLKTQLVMPEFSFWVSMYSARGQRGGAAPPNVNLGSPYYLVKYKK